MVEEIAVLLVRVALVLVLLFGFVIPIARLIAGTRALVGGGALRAGPGRKGERA